MNFINDDFRKKIEKHPRPDFYRENYFDLCGEWEFAFDDENAGVREKWYKGKTFEKTINVPFVYQAKLSGIGDPTEHDVVWYRKKVALKNSKITTISFGACDYLTDVYINGEHAGSHRGGYDSFTFDISSFIIDGENDITVRVEDKSRNTYQQRGKQTWLEGTFGCWYTRHTGIWQPVYITYLSDANIEYFTINPNKDTKQAEIYVKLNDARENLKLKVSIFLRDKFICENSYTLTCDEVNAGIDIMHRTEHWDGLCYWAPECPNLYDVVFELYEGDNLCDTVFTYFGMRKLSRSGDVPLLNDNRYYQRLVLNQGYYPNGLITPDNDQMIIDDINLIKSMGFNGVRIHQKIESSKYLYWCDRLGIVVWEEMPSAYSFSAQAVASFTAEWQSIIKRDINHPSIFTWVPFNESWGILQIRNNKKQQEYTDAIYHLTKAIDPIRAIVSNDGWELTTTDICALHNYTASPDAMYNCYKDFQTTNDPVINDDVKYAFAKGYKYSGCPIMITEFGGISFASDDGWGYNDKVKTPEQYIERFAGLVGTIKKLDFVTGFCYTQFTDVEHEQNGLVDINRKAKIDLEKIRDIVCG